MGQVRHVGGVVQVAHLAVAHVQLEDHRRRRGDQIQVVFALKPVTDDLKVQKPQKPAAEAEPQGRRRLHLIAEAGVVQGQLLDGVAQGFEIVGVHREQPAEHHRLRRLEARQRRGTGLAFLCDCVAHACIADLLDRAGEDTDFTRAQFGDVDHLRRQDGQLVDAVAGACLHHLDLVALADHPIHDADHHDNAQIGVVPAVHQHRLQRRVAVALGRGQARDDGLQDVRDAQTGLGADRDRVLRVDADDFLDVLLDAVGLGRGQVDLVQDRHDLVARVDRLIDVGQRLRLDALAGVDDQQRSLDRAHRPADLIGKVHVARRVDQVQDIGPAVLGRIADPHRVGLDGDPALALDIHAVQHLGLHVAIRDSARGLDQPVGQGGFPVVDMRHDRKIADEVKVGHGRAIQPRKGREKRVSRPCVIWCQGAVGRSAAFSIRRATSADEAGFWPVTRLPSAMAKGCQSGPF